MDRKAWIVIIICAVLFFVNMWDVSRKQQEREAWERENRPPPAEQDPTTIAEEAPGEEAPDGSLVQPTRPPTPERPAEELATLSTDEAKFIFTTHGGGIKAVEILNDETTSEGEFGPVTLNRFGNHPIGALTRGVGKVDDTPFTLLSQTNDEVVFQGTTRDGLAITKTYQLTQGDLEGDLYRVDLHLRLASPQGVFSSESLGLYAGSLGPLQESEWENQTGFAIRADGDSEYKDVNYFKKGWFRAARESYNQSFEKVAWAGVTNQFYATLLHLPEAKDATVWAIRYAAQIPGSDKEKYRAALSLSLPAVSLNPETPAQEFTFEIFAGPKKYPMLTKMEGEWSEIMLYGELPVVGWLASPFSKLLNRGMNGIEGFFRSVPGSFGIAIVLVTLLIRIVLWPLHHRSQRTMKRMAKLGPIMKELREKYQDDAKKLNEETMKLYRDYGVNPLGGCLPMLLQMPIFFGFYRMLMNAVELRHEAFLWVGDLSQPDTIFQVLGFPVNVLPLLMGATMIWQMKVTPQAGDPTQQKIMMFMPLIFLVVCYGFASALALYWTTQNIFSVGQTYLTRNLPEPELKKKPPQKKRSLPQPPSPFQNPNQKPKKKKKRPPRTGG